MKIKDHYTNKIKDYELLTRDDLLKLKNSHVLFISNQGDIKNAKITSIKTWKTRNDVQIGLKYGLYEYASTTLTQSGYSGSPLVQEIEDNNIE